MTNWAHNGYSIRYLKQFGYIRQRNIHNGKARRHESLSLFQINHIRLQLVITLSTSNSLKKKKKKGTKEKDRMRKTGRWKRGEEEKGWKEFKKKKKKKGCDRDKRKEEKKMGREERDRKKEKEADEKAEEEERREKRKEGRRGRKEEEEDKEKNRECGTKDAPPSPNAFPSQKLGNNMTPIKGRLGKNTTPTHGDPEKLIQRRQRNSSEGSRTSSIHPMQTPSTHCEKKNLQKA